MEGCGCYKHSAPLEPGKEWRVAGAANTRCAGARKGMEGWGCCKHSGAGAAHQLLRVTATGQIEIVYGKDRGRGKRFIAFTNQVGPAQSAAAALQVLALNVQRDQLLGITVR